MRQLYICSIKNVPLLISSCMKKTKKNIIIKNDKDYECWHDKIFIGMINTATEILHAE